MANCEDTAFQYNQNGHSNETRVYFDSELEKFNSNTDLTETGDLGCTDTERSAEKTEPVVHKGRKKVDGLLKKQTSRTSQARYKLRHMYNKYTDAMRSGSPTRRIHARALQRRKLKYMSPLSKPPHLSFGHSYSPVKLNKERLAPLPNVGEAGDLTCGNDKQGRTYWPGNDEDPDGMNNTMLVEEYLRKSDSPVKMTHQTLDKLKPVVPKLFSSELQHSEVATKFRADVFTSFSDRSIQRDRFMQNGWDLSGKIQLNGIHMNVEKRQHGQKRLRNNCDDSPDNILAHDIELLDISSHNQDHLTDRKMRHKGAKFGQKSDEEHQRRTKDRVKEIQIYIPTAEREEYSESSSDQDPDQEMCTVEKNLNKRRQKIRMHKLERDKGIINKIYEDILLGRDFPKKRDKKRVPFRSLEFKCAPFENENRVAISLNQLDDITTQNKLPRLKYQTVPGYQISTGLHDFGGLQRYEANGHIPKPNFSAINYSENSNCNNSAHLDEPGNNFYIETSD